MTNFGVVTGGHLVITAFIFLVVDRTAALFVASRKAKRVLARKVTALTPANYQVRSIRWLEEWYWVVQAMIFLAAFWMLGILQIINPRLIQDEIGKIAFATVGFLISFSCSILNSMIEEIDRRL